MSKTSIIPELDISPLVAGNSDARHRLISDIGAACQDIGFLTLTGTGIKPDLINDMRQVVRATFAADEADKAAQSITRENYRGYIPLGFFSPNDAGTGASTNADWYEGFKLHTEIDVDDPVRLACSLYGPNIWPHAVPEARDTILAWWREMERLSRVLLTALAAHLGIDADKLLEPFAKPLSNMTLLHYPARDADACADESQFGIHPHKDTCALTIIAPDPVGGLEVQTRSGDWIEVQCPDGGLVVNIGDMLELWSGGRLVSTPHLVRNKPGQARYSFPWFAVPRHDVTITPLLDPVKGFERPDVNCGYWSAEIWRTNWSNEYADSNTPETGTLEGPGIRDT